ncbi:FadR/GntR family transcriptional regulator [Paraburkholderia sp. Ac-20347]|jgi:GntR family transcriptional regulator, transcriptional repressor for pyruvate dehydrogenase complex|uniref:FadR/GntR family transcriptional regulator n=1 Tax=Paraburkholderia sp. Ac-20347 TaxID=2703892 RepID=UPI00197ECFC3|nr:FadR/GntR family transcriptional regulator [Paraburkholderia sp. Ac-20347]MBN3809515.1 FadR family transcriptional regulator [Paraburkholderia sp. Ac-20347]
MAASLAAPIPARNRNLAEQVVDFINQQIGSRALKPGDKLPTESSLMTQLGVSRTVVREAISRLQAMSVIETRHGIGSFVLEPRREPLELDVVPASTLNDLLSVLELRISLETECAGLAAQRASERDLANIRTALDAISAATHAGGDSAGADLEFHVSVARATGNRYFVDILTQMGAALIPRHRIDSAGIAHRDPKTYAELVNREHESIFEAIARQDPEGARAAMRMHLSSSRERLRRAATESSGKV